MANEIHTTTDYSKFNRLTGNREIKKRAEGIKESIRKIGWITNPIIVNEDMSIIDGQSRFEALKSLGMPIEYVIQSNANVTDCRVMNSYNTTWTKGDYLNSYVEEGNENYIRIKQLADAFSMNFNMIFRALGHDVKGSRELFRDGKVIVTDEQYAKAYKKISLYKKLEPALKRFRGKQETKGCAVFYLAERDDIDFDRLAELLMNCNAELFYTSTVAQVLESMQRVYNFNRQKQNRVYFYEDYRKERG